MPATVSYQLNYGTVEYNIRWLNQEHTNKDTNHVRSSTISHEKIHDEFGWCGWRCSCRIHMKFPNDQFVDKVFVRKYDLVRGMNSLVNNPMLQNMQHAKHHYQNFTFFVTGQPCCYIISCWMLSHLRSERKKREKSKVVRTTRNASSCTASSKSST